MEAGGTGDKSRREQNKVVVRGRSDRNTSHFSSSQLLSLSCDSVNFSLGHLTKRRNVVDGCVFVLWCCCSQVAWKLLETYPVQMEIARRSTKLPPARITLGYAARQREVQVSAVHLLTCQNNDLNIPFVSSDWVRNPVPQFNILFLYQEGVSLLLTY